MITSHTDNAVELSGAGKKYAFLHKTQGHHSREQKDDLWALKDVSFNVARGRILGVIGRNGAGKTTLLNLVAGVLAPTQGAVSVRGRVLGLFNLGVGFQDEMTGRENIFLNGAILGALRKELEDKLERIIAFSELGDFIDMPLGTYSQGMRLRLGFSVIANLDCDILVIDEILAVGDALFQNKCFERLMEFKRAGRTLIISSQSAELIERLCDSAVLLAHGSVVFFGDPVEACNRHSALLNSEKFYVGPVQRPAKLVENTKKWSDDVSMWGRELGTREVNIEKVEFLNRFGWKQLKTRPNRPLKIKVHFSVRDIVREAHFGVAIFREDGVYCYGPNTKFEGHLIQELKQGEGYFALEYDSVLLAPGEYRISVAIWDKNETVAYAYNHGYYRLTIEGGDNPGRQLIAIPFKGPGWKVCNPSVAELDAGILQAAQRTAGYSRAHEALSVRILDSRDRESERLTTGERATISVDFNKTSAGNGSYLWIGLYRDDDIYCQGIICPIDRRDHCAIEFPEMMLLPGGYNLSAGVWDDAARRFIALRSQACRFRMVFDREDHGTVYLKHRWSWKLP